MFRKTLTILSFIGLLLSAGLWARSYCWIDTLATPTSGQDHFKVCSVLGVITVGLFYNSRGPPVKEVLYFTSDAQEYARSIQKMRTTIFRDWKAWRNPNRPFRWDNSTITARGVTFRTKAISFPHWLLVLSFSIPSFLGGVKALRRRKRKKLGLCVTCGYDLRASKDRCPECNTPFEHAKLGQDNLRPWRVRFLGATRHYSSLVMPLLMIFVVLVAFVIGSCFP